MGLGSASDSEIVARCREGDQAAWSELVERFSRYVYAIATRVYRLRDRDAEDVFQEAFARTFERLEELRDDAAVRSWIGQLTRRLCVDRLRTNAKEELLGGKAREPARLAEDTQQLEEALLVRDALATLPADCGEVLDRFFGRDQSYRTISAALDIPQGTIASRISRCLAKLRVALEGRNPAGDSSSNTEGASS